MLMFSNMFKVWILNLVEGRLNFASEHDEVKLEKIGFGCLMNTTCNDSLLVLEKKVQRWVEDGADGPMVGGGKHDSDVVAEEHMRGLRVIEKGSREKGGVRLCA